MHGDPLLQFVTGASVMACLVAVLFFARFWRRTREPLFAWFAVAFGLMGLNWQLLALSDPSAEFRPYLYLLRLAAYAMIAAAVIQKNRRRPRSDGRS
jgi:uncharacterized membrane protein